MTTGLLGITASARGAAAPADGEVARGASAAGLAQATSRMPTTSSARLHSAGGDMAPLPRPVPDQERIARRWRLPTARETSLRVYWQDVRPVGRGAPRPPAAAYPIKPTRG